MSFCQQLSAMLGRIQVEVARNEAKRQLQVQHLKHTLNDMWDRNHNAQASADAAHCPTQTHSTAR